MKWHQYSSNKWFKFILSLDMIFNSLASFHFHMESLVISHIVNDQTYAIVIAQPNLHHQIGAIEIVDICRQSLKECIFCQFTDSRMIAAPMITKRKTTGIIRFTPDCTREEAEQIVKGLTTAIKEIKKNSNTF